MIDTGRYIHTGLGLSLRFVVTLHVRERASAIADAVESASSSRELSEVFLVMFSAGVINTLQMKLTRKGNEPQLAELRTLSSTCLIFVVSSPHLAGHAHPNTNIPTAEAERRVSSTRSLI